MNNYTELGYNDRAKDIDACVMGYDTFAETYFGGNRKAAPKAYQQYMRGVFDWQIE